jgi:hypothetical protein
MSRVKVTQHFLGKTISDTSSSFYVERRPGGKWLCFKEHEVVVAETMISKKSFHALMRFTTGVTCQLWVDVSKEGTSKIIIDNDVADNDDLMLYRKRRMIAAPSVPIKREMNPFIVQIFDPRP